MMLLLLKIVFSFHIRGGDQFLSVFSKYENAMKKIETSVKKSVTHKPEKVIASRDTHTNVNPYLLRGLVLSPYLASLSRVHLLVGGTPLRLP